MHPPPVGPWVDTHCHLDRFLRAGTREGILERAAAAGVSQMITIGTSPEDWPLYAGLAGQFPDRIFWTAGIHPCDVDEHWEAGVAALPGQWRCAVPPVGIGEIGLDAFHLPGDPAAAAAIFSRQEAAFSAQLELARSLPGPVVVHSRGAFARTVELIDASGLDWTRVVFHCFVEGPTEMAALRQRGGRGSFTGILTYPKADNVRAAAVAQGIAVAMVETDAPFLAPVPHRGKANEPGFVSHVGARLAEVLGLPAAEVAAATTATARAFFGLPAPARAGA